ncbi:MAG: hypothetical protein QM760_20915 [Nibricoccus sp.]
MLPWVAIWFGTKWENVSSRTDDVSVVFKSGVKETGVLSRAWNDAYVLEKTDGTSIHFRDFSMIELVAKPPVEDSSFLLNNWRLCLCFIVGVAPMIWALLSGWVESLFKMDQVSG